MINRVKALFADRSGAPEARADRHSHEELQIAAAALMVEAAQLDDAFDARERTKIRELVVARFELTSEEGDNLIEAAEGRVADSIELHGFVRVVKSAFTPEERIELMELLWEVVYADGLTCAPRTCTSPRGRTGAVWCKSPLPGDLPSAKKRPAAGATWPAPRPSRPGLVPGSAQHRPSRVRR